MKIIPETRMYYSASFAQTKPETEAEWRQVLKTSAC